MNILLHDYAGHHFPVQLSRELARRGHKINHLYAGYNNTPRGPLAKCQDDPECFSSEAVYISKPLQKYSFVKRWMQEWEYGRLLAAKVEAIRPDIVISAQTPLDAQAQIMSRSEKLNIPFVFWLQDVIGIATHSILSKKLPLAGNVIGNYYIGLEKRLLRKSQSIVMITEDFKSLLSNWGVDANKAVVIPNWASVDEIPVLPRSNPWSRENGLDQAFCFMYSGTLGLKHNPELLLNLAIHFKNDLSVKVVVASETVGANWLKEKKAELGLENLVLLGFQPYDQLPYMLASADVFVAILDAEAGFFSVPSKVLSYLCAQRPILLSIPTENLAGRIVQSNQAGIVAKAGNQDAFLRGAQDLRDKPELRELYARNGRKYAEQNFDIECIADKFEQIFFAL